MEKSTKRVYTPPISLIIPVCTEYLLQKTSVSHAYPQSTEEEWGHVEIIVDKDIDIDD
ncbi:hypothetical protein KZY75_04635 [Prevotella salivae]|uniref:hypothetical protein n=1 Tax=Segatella salivae TaxID=228604 RepID=UPI001C5E8371|nr:hypothetical protein [Segatella salivae]MBW4907169.1 hypothetical protein [Segatella salivae]MBW4909330.1 hypothetical protein [Segatella salivae]